MAQFLSPVLALLGGVLPALVWLSFWLREDKEHPEPRRLIIAVFLAGALAVIPTYLIQELMRALWQLSVDDKLLPTITAWAASEELIKYLVVAGIAFSTSAFDEPIDAMIYLITAALGFAAAENSLFMFNVLLSDNSNHVNFWLNGNFRFIGATIVHVVSSSILGGFIALAFCETRARRLLALIAGLCTATILHAAFNYFIIKSASSDILKIFILFWALAIVIIYLFERVKKVVCYFRPNL